MKIETIKDATVHPYTFRDRKFQGGFAQDDARDLARMPGETSFRDEPMDAGVPAITVVKGRYLFAGPVWNHFGHIMTDSLHRLWPLIHNPNQYDGLIFLSVTNLRVPRDGVVKMPQVALDLLTLMGLPSNLPIHFITEPTSIEILDIPEVGCSTKTGLKEPYRPYLQHYQSAIRRKIGNLANKVPRKIFYSRSHTLNDGGVIGIQYFEDRLRQQGYVSVVPEEMSLKMQFAFAMEAESIVFEEGSALHITDILNDVGARAFMLRRRSKATDFERALRPRVASFYNLVGSNNILQLPDRNGNMGVASLSMYLRPEQINERMLALELNVGSFDSAEYSEAERMSLMSCPAGNNKIKAARNNLWRQARGL
tara:strand:+ start:8 stop:1108 length:1101 start_codon:yes stop_codon:yes gene_type:complete